ncbi:MAG: class I SAM-dependent methyltransferase [Dehalococcoidia bacterium]|nr:class I SAM-dependent methyltransferase [Dehalococcoidia bacterium]
MTPTPVNQPWAPPAGISRRNQTLTRARRDLAGIRGRVLEAGAGTARFVRGLRSANPAIQPIACDLVLDGLKYARRQDAAIEAAQADITSLPFRAGAFKAVLVFDVLEHLPRPQDAVAELWRVLEPNGRLHALVPCEGQPLTLHWLMWKSGVGADIKERSVGHVQRFTHRGILTLLTGQGFTITNVSYSMHPLGQAKDVLLHLEEDHRLPRWLARNPLYRAINRGLWAGAFVESTVLRNVPLSAVALHITAVKP